MSWIENPGSEFFGAFNLTDLNMDEAWLNVTNLSERALWLYQRSSDCYSCPFSIAENDPLLVRSSHHFKFNTKFPQEFRLRTVGDDMGPSLENDEYEYCTLKNSFGEFGVYELTAWEAQSCRLVTLLDPVNIYLPITIVVLFFLLVGIARFLFKKYSTRWLNKVSDGAKTHPILRNESSVIENTTSSPQSKKPRLRSLDTFRGICIIIMIFVNDGGGGYYFTSHATWDGLCVADLVFPWFLWIMGVCIPMSIQSQLKRDVLKRKIFWKILIRSVKLIGIGLILNSKAGPVDLKGFRLPGVLQRFGICYFATASFTLLSLDKTNSKTKLLKLIEDIVILWKGWLLALIILVIHTCLTLFLPVPDCPTGYLGPGGLHEEGSHLPKCIGGAAGYIDQTILTNDYIFRFPTALFTYRSEVYDPEGLLGSLTSIFQVWLGVQAGLILSVHKRVKGRTIRWLIWGIVCGAIGTALCGGQQTGFGIPVNKNLWSISFVMVTTCFAFILLAALYIIVDVKNWWTGTPFYEPGMNSILLYVGHSVANVMLPWHFRYGRFRTHFVYLVEATWGTSLWVLTAIYLHAKKFFWSL